MRGVFAATVAAMVLVGCGGSGGGEPRTAPTTARAADEPPTTRAVDDRRLAARLLPDVGVMGAGWVQLNREPEGPDDPTLPTAPELSGDCGGARAVDESGAAFVLFERRRGVDLDEQAIVYGLLFSNDDDAAAQVALYRSATLENCVRDSYTAAVPELGLAVAVEDRALPELDAGVDASARRVRATATVDGFAYEGGTELTVLRSGRAVVLVVRDVAIGAPDPFPLDTMLRDVAARLAEVG